MSDTWEKFEIESTNFLNKNYPNYASFTHKGKSDSTLPDIRVDTKSGQQFYIEAKHCPAQCGQFVLLPNDTTRSFDYSPLNASPVNNYSQIIIDYMNDDYEAFKNAGTAGKDILLPEKCFIDWVVNYYKNKCVRFFITNEFLIIPIDDFGNAFNINAKYRIKRSGSSSVGKVRIPIVSEYLVSQNYAPVIEGDKIFVNEENNIHDNRFYLGNYEYMYSARDDRYEIRKLSNTYNANVIFSITLKEAANSLTASEFEKELL